MRTCKKIFSFILLFIFLSQVVRVQVAFAAEVMPAPKVLRNEAKYPDQPPIGYNVENGGYYFDLKWTDWDAGEIPAGGTPYLNFYLREIGKYNASTSFSLKEQDIPRSVYNTGLRIGNLKSGTIYYVNSKAYYNKTNPDGTSSKSPESATSNTVKVLSDIKIASYSSGPNQITIEWDDVWDVGKRIDYKLYISQNKDFSGVDPMYIRKAQIGENGPVVPNQATGKLVYVHTVQDPGSVYYVKIEPDISDTEIKKTSQSSTVAVSSYILATTSRMGTTDVGTRWRLSWTPIVTNLGSSDINVSYKIYRAVNSQQSNLAESVATIKDSTNYYFMLTNDEANKYYYYIQAVVKWKSSNTDVYPVEIKSDNIIVREPEVSSKPATPEIVDDFRRIPSDPSTAIISYDGELKPNSATILWRLPKNGAGVVDNDITYDIYLITNPNLIDNPLDNDKKAPLESKNAVQVKDGANVMGFKYVLTGLTPNSTYYFKMVATKTFFENRNGVLTKVKYSSEPALKVIITPADGAFDKPLVPAKPPFKLKKTADGTKLMVTDTSVTIQMKNRWYEKFNTTTGTWEYIKTEKDNQADTSDITDIHYDLANDRDDISVVDAVYTRAVSYDAGVTIDVGCVPFTDGINIATAPTDKITGVPSTTPNLPYLEGRNYNPDPLEERTFNQDQRKHNIDITITGLEPNTTYILWLRANRAGVANSLSAPSIPIIVTTNPQLPSTVEKPTVPSFNYIQAGDTFADFGWPFKPGYKYYIKYGTTDDIAQASGAATITAADYVTYYRVKGLKADTLYYFWIRAEATNGSLTSQSEWSDSTPLRTLKDIPPETPRGFGVKTPQKDNITKNSITFEWLKEPNLEYIIEIAGGVDYKDIKEYSAKDASELKISDLRSNFRYFARLYAYDPVKKLRSAPTQSVTVRTLRSSDDYDSDQDIENVITGEYIIKDGNVINGTWSIKILGVNADRFVESMKTDHVLDYTLDATTPPTKAARISIRISNKVFDGLNKLNESLIIATPSSYVYVRPNMLVNNPNETGISKYADFSYEIAISAPSTTANTASAENLTMKSSTVNISIKAFEGNNGVAVQTLGKPLKVAIPYNDVNWFKEGVTSAFQYDKNKDSWEKLNTTHTYDVDNDKGKVTFEMAKPGDFAVADQGTNYFDDVTGTQYETAITNVEKVHKLKSIDGRTFDPDSNANMGDAVKFMLDVLDTSYNTDYMAIAAKAGLISKSEVDKPYTGCTREKALVMAARVYEIKTSQKAVPERSLADSIFSDLGTVDAASLPKVKFAVENGFVDNNGLGYLYPKDTVSRGEVIGILEKMLAFIGEID